LESTLGRILEDKTIQNIQTHALDHDIQSYIRQRLAADPDLRKWQNDAIIRQEIETTLMERAEGMYESSNAIC